MDLHLTRARAPVFLHFGQITESMTRKNNRWVAKLVVSNDADPPRHAPMLAFADTVPWPTIVLDEQGDVQYLNAAMRATGREWPTAGSAAFEKCFPEYFAVLKGAPCWLTQQEATVCRQVSPLLAITERLWLRCLPTGACLIVMDQTRLHHLESAHAQTARLASLGFMLASASHEINNPLAAVHSILQVLQANKPVSPESLDKGLRNMASSVRRLLAITRKLNGFARVGNSKPEAFRVDAAIEEAATLLGYDSLGETTELHHAREPAAWVFGQVDQLLQVFHNIFLNAAQSMRGIGSIAVKTILLEHTLEICIHDSGPGLSAEVKARLFDPFFTTKPSGEGTGLGLAICHEIVHEHNGSIRADNHPAGGALFIITLPRFNPARAPDEG